MKGIEGGSEGEEWRRGKEGGRARGEGGRRGKRTIRRFASQSLWTLGSIYMFLYSI